MRGASSASSRGRSPIRGESRRIATSPKNWPGAEGGDPALLAVVLADDLDLALDDDEELVRRRSLADDHRARLDLDRLQARPPRVATSLAGRSRKTL